MNRKFKTAALAFATAVAIGGSGLASAAGIITNADGSFGWTGFDWSQEGQAQISGYDITSATAAGTVDPFTLQFQATATALKDLGGVNFLPPNMRPNNAADAIPQYEYTIFATIQETGTCIDIDGPGGANCGAVLFTVTGGSYTVYYDTSADAVYAAGTGFTDGATLLSGSITGATPVLAPQGPSNPGNATLGATIFANVTLTNAAFIVPDQSTTTASTTLQFGTGITQPWTPAAAYNGVPTCSTPPNNTCYQAQADANQTFFAPEPTTLALLGFALAALGFSSRRRAQ